MRLPFDVSFSNYFMELIREKGYEVDLDIEPHLSYYNEIHNVLLKLAIEDSKKQSVFYCRCYGSKDYWH